MLLLVTDIEIKPITNAINKHTTTHIQQISTILYLSNLFDFIINKLIN